jgi:hypothetical protein
MSNKIPVWSWRQAIEKSKLKTHTKCLLGIIANDISDCGKFSRRTLEELAEATSMSRRSVITHVDLARAAGFLETRQSRDAAGRMVAMRYYPKFPAEYQLMTAPAEDGSESPGAGGAPSRKNGQKQQNLSADPAQPECSSCTPPCTPYKETFPQTLPIEEARASASPVDNRADDQRISRAQQLRAIAADLRSAERPKAECRQSGTKTLAPAPSGLSPSAVGEDRAEPRQEGAADACLSEEAGLTTGKALGSEQVDAAPAQNRGIAPRRATVGEGDRTSNVRNTERLERWVGRMRRELAAVMAKPPGFAMA